MRVFPARQSRQEYLQTQIARSDTKFRYCKVSVHDVLKYRSVLLQDLGSLGGGVEPGPILCLGTRNGREVDLFRMVFFGPPPLRRAVRLLEWRTHSFVSLFPPVEAVGRSDFRRLTATSAVGVEINPRGTRSDVWTGSFDEMPAAWEDAFGVLFSNSFDQSHDPRRTAGEWKRVLRPGGFLIFLFSKDAEPSASDPVGGLRLADVQDLFGGELVYYRERGSGNRYSEAIIRLVKT